MVKARKKDFGRFVQAAKDGALDDLRDVVLKCKADDFVDRRDEQEWSALFWAVFNGHFGVVKYLVEALSADVKQVDPQGRSALYLSCAWGGECGESGDLTKYLIDHGADIHGVTTDGWSPLYLTAFRGKTSAAKHLLEAGADVLHQDSKGRSVLAIAKATKHSQMVPILSKAAVNRMFTASHEGKSSVLQSLIEEYNLDVNERNDAQRTALHVAMEAGHEGAVKILICCGADDAVKDADGKTPIALAEKLGKRGAISALQAAIEVREEHRKSRIILEKERLMLLKERKMSREVSAATGAGEAGSDAPASAEACVKEAKEGPLLSAPGAGIMNFEISSYAVKILAKMPAGVTWRDIDQMMEDLDIVDDIVVEEPDLSDLLNWSVWETDHDIGKVKGAEAAASSCSTGAKNDLQKEESAGRASSETSSDGIDFAPAKPHRSHSSRRRVKRQQAGVSGYESEETDDEYDESGDEEEPAW